MHLENLGILHPDGRELVIERLMALDDDAVEEDHVKWVVLMVILLTILMMVLLMVLLLEIVMVRTKQK